MLTVAVPDMPWSRPNYWPRMSFCRACDHSRPPSGDEGILCIPGLVLEEARTSGLDRDCRTLIGLPPPDFLIPCLDPRGQSYHPARPNPSPMRLQVPRYIHPRSVCQELPPISTSRSPLHVPCSPPPMYETRRLVEAASALSALLQARGVPHAFYGDVLISLLANQPLAAVRSLVAGRRTFLMLFLSANFMHRARWDPTPVPARSRRPPFRGRFLDHLIALV